MRTIETENAPAALGPYSQGTVAGNLVFTAGQIPVDPSTGKMPETVEAQARQAFANVKAILEAAGATSIANVNLFLKDMNDFAAVNAVYAEFFGKPYPARTCVEVSDLPKGALLEVAAVGIVGQRVPEPRTPGLKPFTVLHTYNRNRMVFFGNNIYIDEHIREERADYPMSELTYAMKKAFPFTIPILAGYLFMGAAFGVMFADMGYNVLWAILVSLVVYAGSGQYLAVNFFVPGFSFLQAIFLTVMVNIRHVFYGLSLVDRYNRFGLSRWYMIFGMTDETFSLICTSKVPEDVSDEKFCLSITLLNHIYWIGGTIIGALLATALPFNSEGVEFAMTALFIVLFLELWMSPYNRLSELLGVFAALVCLLVFGADNFVLPTMLLIIAAVVICRKKIDVHGGKTDA